MNDKFTFRAWGDEEEGFNCRGDFDSFDEAWVAAGPGGSVEVFVNGANACSMVMSVVPEGEHYQSM